MCHIILLARLKEENLWETLFWQNLVNILCNQGGGEGVCKNNWRLREEGPEFPESWFLFISTAKYMGLLIKDY